MLFTHTCVHSRCFDVIVRPLVVDVGTYSVRCTVVSMGLDICISVYIILSCIFFSLGRKALIRTVPDLVSLFVVSSTGPRRRALGAAVHPESRNGRGYTEAPRLVNKQAERHVLQSHGLNVECLIGNRWHSGV